MRCVTLANLLAEQALSSVKSQNQSNATTCRVRLRGWEPEMPLVKSKSDAAFRKNVKAELAAGKEPKQAVAIAYSVKREAQKQPAKGKK